MVSSSSDAAKRKRDRDKESQRRKRQREREYIDSLEQRIRELQYLLRQKGLLERVTCSADGQPMIATTATPLAPSIDRSPACIQYVSPESPGQGNEEHERDCPASLVHRPLEHFSNSALNPSTPVTISLRVLEACLAAPPWRRLPLHGLSLLPDARQCVRGNQLPAFIRSMRTDPTLKNLCPPMPKIIDILFRGSKNPLANFIASACSEEPLPSPEKLAISWTLYLYCRWLIWPSEESFALLPKHLHPTAMQLTVQHPWCIDLVGWPEIRENMIRTQSRTDIDAAIGLLLCSTRMRCSFNSNPVFQQNNGDLEFDGQFYDMFPFPGNWGLLEKFWEDYPDLVNGLDPGVRIREEDLLPL